MQLSFFFLCTMMLVEGQDLWKRSGLFYSFGRLFFTLELQCIMVIFRFRALQLTCLFRCMSTKKEQNTGYFFFLFFAQDITKIWKNTPFLFPTYFRWCHDHFSMMMAPVAAFPFPSLQLQSCQHRPANCCLIYGLVNRKFISFNSLFCYISSYYGCHNLWQSSLYLWLLFHNKGFKQQMLACYTSKGLSIYPD